MKRYLLIIWQTARVEHFEEVVRSHVEHIDSGEDGPVKYNGIPSAAQPYIGCSFAISRPNIRVPSRGRLHNAALELFRAADIAVRPLSYSGRTVTDVRKVFIAAKTDLFCYKSGVATVRGALILRYMLSSGIC